jgi:hypothetical protein
MLRLEPYSFLFPNTLQEEHFQALEHFCNEYVQNSEVTHGDIKTEAALVLLKTMDIIQNPNDNTCHMAYR